MAQGKRAVVFHSETKNSSWQGPIATVEAVCVDPHNLVHTGDAFGATLLADMEGKGAYVIKVEPGSIAERAGLKHADIVLEYDGHRIATAAELQTAISNTAAGSHIAIKLYRDQLMVLTAKF